MKSLAGQLLLSSPRLVDPNFAKTVVLMVQHDGDGALGVVLNRALDVSVKDACSKVLETPCTLDGVIYHGGPCPGPLMVVHSDPSQAQIEVCRGAHFTTERHHIESLLQRTDIRHKFFIGYAGWAAGQLDAEMETGSWLTTPATADEVFDTDTDTDTDTDGARHWTRLTTQVTVGRWVNPKMIPKDPKMN